MPPRSPPPWLLLLGHLGAASVCSWADGDGDSGCAPARAPFCPFKGVDLNRSGFSPHAGPFNLSRAAWAWSEPAANRRSAYHAFDTTPVMDGRFNVYIPSTSGWLYSLDRHGALRWQFDTAGENPGNLALGDDGGAVYAVNMHGVAVAVDAGTGAELWRRKIARAAPSDKHSLVVRGGVLVTACNPEAHVERWRSNAFVMSEAICALDARDGSLRWSYHLLNRSIPGREFALACNAMPAIVGDSVIAADSWGAVYRLDIRDGREIWVAPPMTSPERVERTGGFLPYGTTATAAVGPNDVVYHAFNVEGGRGILRAHDIRHGGLVWERGFKEEINAPIAVGPLRPRGPLAVIAATGANLDPRPVSALDNVMYQLGLTPSVAHAVYAIDVRDGSTMWTFTTPPTIPRDAGNWHDESTDTGLMCVPDVWGSPVIGADGTVYVTWSGGTVFALRDRNGDGTVDAADPGEVSSHRHGYNANGPLALGPGFAVAPSCSGLHAFEV